jgi:hypothetical protein
MILNTLTLEHLHDYVFYSGTIVRASRIPVDLRNRNAMRSEKVHYNSPACDCKVLRSRGRVGALYLPSPASCSSRSNLRFIMAMASLEVGNPYQPPDLDHISLSEGSPILRFTK